MSEVVALDWGRARSRLRGSQSTTEVLLNVEAFPFPYRIPLPIANRCSPTF